MKDKKKMFIIHPSLAPYRVDLFNFINKHFDLTVYFEHKNVENQKFDQEWLKSESLFKIEYLTVGFNPAKRAIRFDVITVLKQGKPDIVVCSEYGSSTLISFLFKKIVRRKFDLYTMCDDSLDIAQNRKGFRSFLRNYLSSTIDGVILHSKELINWYVSNVSAKTKYFELPIIHDEKKMKQTLEGSLEHANSYIQKYQLKGHKVILFVGRLVEIKNIYVLIEAFHKSKNHDSKLVIVGSGEAGHYLKALVKKREIEDKVIFAGRKEYKELYAWYILSQVLVLPSIHEPYGVVVNEALICGCDVICSKRAGAMSLISASNGRVFDPHNITELTSFLNDMLHEQQVVPTKISNVRESKMLFSFDDVSLKFVNNID